MGLLDRFKKKDDFDNPPYIPDDGSLPPLPPAGRGMDLPPLPPMPKLGPKDHKGLPPLPPMPKAPAGVKDVPPPPMPKAPTLPILPKKVALPDIDNDNDNLEPLPDLPPLQTPPASTHDDDLVPKDADSGLTPPAVSKRQAKVFVQLNKYNDIVKTVQNMEGRINDLQNSINQIKDIRTKEGEVIESWNRLLTEAKSKIEEVNNKLPGVDNQ